MVGFLPVANFSEFPIHDKITVICHHGTLQTPIINSPTTHRADPVGRDLIFDTYEKLDNYPYSEMNRVAVTTLGRF